MTWITRTLLAVSVATAPTAGLAPAASAAPSAGPSITLRSDWYRIIQPWRYDEGRRFEDGWNRGADVAPVSGLVRSPGPGVVQLVGRVAGRLVVTVASTLDGRPVVLTFTGLSSTSVSRGDAVRVGTLVGEGTDVHIGAYDRSRRSRYFPILGASAGAVAQQGRAESREPSAARSTPSTSPVADLVAARVLDAIEGAAMPAQIADRDIMGGGARARATPEVGGGARSARHSAEIGSKSTAQRLSMPRIPLMIDHVVRLTQPRAAALDAPGWDAARPGGREAPSTSGAATGRHASAARFHIGRMPLLGSTSRSAPHLPGALIGADRRGDAVAPYASGSASTAQSSATSSGAPRDRLPGPDAAAAAAFGVEPAAVLALRLPTGTVATPKGTAPRVGSRVGPLRQRLTAPGVGSAGRPLTRLEPPREFGGGGGQVGVAESSARRASGSSKSSPSGRSGQTVTRLVGAAALAGVVVAAWTRRQRRRGPVERPTRQATALPVLLPPSPRRRPLLQHLDESSAPQPLAWSDGDPGTLPGAPPAPRHDRAPEHA